MNKLGVFVAERQNVLSCVFFFAPTYLCCGSAPNACENQDVLQVEHSPHPLCACLVQHHVVDVLLLMKIRKRNQYSCSTIDNDEHASRALKEKEKLKGGRRHRFSAGYRTQSISLVYTRLP